MAKQGGDEFSEKTQNRKRVEKELRQKKLRIAHRKTHGIDYKERECARSCGLFEGERETGVIEGEIWSGREKEGGAEFIRRSEGMFKCQKWVSGL